MSIIKPLPQFKVLPRNLSRILYCTSGDRGGGSYAIAGIKLATPHKMPMPVKLITKRLVKVAASCERGGRETLTLSNRLRDLVRVVQMQRMERYK
jgi:hypothetical protein